MNPFYNYLYDRQEARTVSHCSSCGYEIYEYDTCCLRGAYVICGNCANDDDVLMAGYELDQYFNQLYGGQYE